MMSDQVQTPEEQRRIRLQEMKDHNADFQSTDSEAWQEEDPQPTASTSTAIPSCNQAITEAQCETPVPRTSVPNLMPGKFLEQIYPTPKLVASIRKRA